MIKKINVGTIELTNISYGMWRVTEYFTDAKQFSNFANELLKLGINTIDTAQVYGKKMHEAESFLSDLFRDPTMRQQFKVITKTGIGGIDQNGNPVYGFYDFSKKNIVNSLNNSLKAMNTNYVDLFLLHRPDYFASFSEIRDAFIWLKKENKVLEFGVSNFSPLEFESLNKYLNRYGINLVTNQIEHHIFTTEHIDNNNFYYFKNNEIHPMIWSPFGGGQLFENPPQLIIDLAAKYNVDIQTIALSYIQESNLKPIIILGSNKIKNYHKIINNGFIKLSKQEMYMILNQIGKKEIK